MDRQPDLYTKSHDVERAYRECSAGDLSSYRICIGESDLLIQSGKDLRAVIAQQLKSLRRQIKQYIAIYPVFATSLTPFPPDEQAPEVVRWMVETTARAGVGPMAAVAGAIAGMLGKGIEPEVSDLIIENGGDIYLRSTRERVIAVHAGKSVLSNRIGLLIPAHREGIGICTSAGTVGPSLSFGKADACVIISPDAALADAVATAAGNLVKTIRDLEQAVRFAQNIAEITGVLIIKDDRMTAWGEIELVPVK